MINRGLQKMQTPVNGAVNWELTGCELRNVKVLIAKWSHNYDFLLLHKESEVLRNNHS